MLNDENSYLFKFAWKSIRRNAGRSFFIGFSVSLAVFIAVWVVAFFDGLNHQIEEAVVNTNTGYFQLQEKAYARSTDSSQPQVLTEDLKQLLRYPVKSYSPELVLDGNISTPEGAAGLAVLGVDPALHAQFLPVEKSISEGAFLAESDTDSVVIGEELATLFKFHIGDQMVLNYQDQQGQLRSEILNIKGIFHFNGKGFEKRFVYINQRTWQKLFLNEDRQTILFNRITLMTEGLEAKDKLTKRFSSFGLEMKSWKNLNPEMAVVLEFHDGMIRFFFLIIGITITMTILTPVQMLWQERLKELRMLNIIGVSSSKFWKIGLFEIFQMIIYSTAISSIILVVIIGIQSKTGIDFTFLNKGVAIERAGIQLPAIIFPQLQFTQILITFAFVVLVLSISYLWSIYRTLKKLEVAA